MDGQVKVLIGRGIEKLDRQQWQRLKAACGAFQQHAHKAKSNWTAFSLIDVNPLTYEASLAHLHPLHNLLLGYLMVWKPEVLLPDDDWHHVYQSHGILQRESNRRAKKLTAHKRLFRPLSKPACLCSTEPAGPDDMGWFWFDVCLPSVRERNWSELELALGSSLTASGNSIANLKRLYCLLRRQCLGLKPADIERTTLPKLDTQSECTSFLAAAFRELQSLFAEREKSASETGG
jgi:hypothetical protein